jgi:hypothetical protein
MLWHLILDVLTIGTQALVCVLIWGQCRHPWRYRTWTAAWYGMLAAQLTGVALRIGNVLEAHGWSLPNLALTVWVPLFISCALIYFLVIFRRMFLIDPRKWFREQPP